MEIRLTLNSSTGQAKVTLFDKIGIFVSESGPYNCLEENGWNEALNEVNRLLIMNTPIEPN